MVNEAHYLVKAKNFWQPDWCRPRPFCSVRQGAHHVLRAAGLADTSLLAGNDRLDRTFFRLAADRVWSAKTVMEIDSASLCRAGGRHSVDHRELNTETLLVNG